MSRRRYKIGINPPYDQRFDRYKGSSAVLNPKRFQINLVQMQMVSKSGLQALIERYEGLIDREGEELAAIGQDLKIAARRQGLLEPTELPKDVIIQRLKTEAKLDVLGEELDLLRKSLADIESREETVRADNVLKYGPRGHAKGDPPRMIDGQPVVEREGELVIICPASPYNEMRLEEYYTLVVSPFLESRRPKPMTEEERKTGHLRPTRWSTGVVSRESLPPRPEKG